MKLFSPLTLGSFNNDGVDLYPASQNYRVVRIVASNGQAINPNDLLFVIEPVETPA